jgi:L-amino acid N-acyltransferase YncA
MKKSSTMNIRPAIQEDLPSVLELYAQPEIDQGESLTVEEATTIFQRFTQYPDYRLFVAVADSVVVGTFALLIMDKLCHLGKAAAVAAAVSVLPGWKSQTFAKRMIKSSMGASRKAGC